MAIQSVMINLDKPRRLRFGMGAMVAFEQITGKMLQSIETDETYETTAQILWIMLMQDDPELTFVDTCKLVDENADSLDEVSNKIREAIAAATNTGKHSKNV